MLKSCAKVLFFSLLACANGNALANVVSVTDAKQLAEEFYRAGSGRQAAGTDGLVLVKTAGAQASPSYYVFNARDGRGFVIVSGEDCTQPVLGYSFENPYSTTSSPAAMEWMMAGIEKEIKAAKSTQASVPAARRRQMARAAAVGAREVVLSTPAWSQEAPFNSMIPGRPLSGCVGTAMAAIMKYHNYPAKGTGSYDGVNFDVEYDWDNMRTDNYRHGYSEAEASAVATLVWHAAKSVDTQFGMSGSSAYEVRVPAALSSYFNYDPGVSYKKRSEVGSQQAWDKIVTDEIDAGRPVLYCGQDVTAGHAFICDGYNDQGYLHFNWGWGGAANGFFLSTALNPSVSTTHNFNNLNTIIYNIKPGKGDNQQWSPVHITADGRQAGMGSDITELIPGKKFTVRVGNLKNLSYADFSGKLAVALFDASGSFKALLSQPSNLSLKSMTNLTSGYTDFRNCSLAAGVSVEAGDMIRMATSADNGATWLAVAGELPTVNEIPATRQSPDCFNITLPGNMAGATVSGADKVVRGWDYSFDVTLTSPAEDVVTVRANGYVLTPGADSRYTISNVREDQLIDVMVRKASEVVAKRSFWVGTPGQLSSIIPDAETGTIKDLTLFGTIDERDFEFMRTKMKLTRLDISAVNIAAYGSNQANAIPRQAFSQLGSLREVVLPGSVTRLNNGCFRQSGITSIVIPAGVSTFEYNVFNSARSLRDIWVGRETAEFINWCVLSGVNVGAATLHVPSQKAVTNYSNKEYWKDIANIVVDPIPAREDYAFAVMDDADVKFNADREPGRVAKGTVVKFTAEHIADNDDRMEVYANSTLLRPAADGTYTATVNGNTIIHFEMIKPVETSVNPSYWTLTDFGGTVGLITDAVNVIPGQEFVIRANALKIPSEWSSMFWAAALTDKDGNIKEFISPISVYTGASGDGLKMNITCCVKESTVREGNMIRLVTSYNKKTWALVEGSSDKVVDAIPALNNVTPVYNINFPTLDNATVTGVVPTAVRGRDITIKIVPKTVSDRINMMVNGVPVAKEAPSVTYSFIAKEDMDFEVEVYSPKVIDEVTYTVKPGELFSQVTPSTIKPRVIVVGEVYANDLSNAFQQDFAQKTVTHLDLSQVSIVAGGNYAANVIPSELFYKPSAVSQVVPKVQEIILPDNIIRIESGAFKNCANIKEMKLPENLYTWDGSGKEYGGLKTKIFEGCSSLTTLYVPCPSKNGKVHQFDFKANMDNNLGISNPAKVTVVVKPEYLEDYLRVDGELGSFDLLFNGGNGWKMNGFNIVAEYPVYSVNFDPIRCHLADEKFDTDVAASFLGDNVSKESITVADKIIVNKPAGTTVRVYDNGAMVTPSANGAVPVTFYNPNKHSDKSGNHEIKVAYYYDVTFRLSSDMFVVDVPELRNNESLGSEATLFESFSYYDILKPELYNVAENSDVKFSLKMNTTHAGDIQPRVKVGEQVVEKGDDGYYTVKVTDANVTVDIFAVPVNGATLGQDELNSIDVKEAVDITSISLEGNVSVESLKEVVSEFVSLENLDLSRYGGELPQGVFAGKEKLKSVILPEMEAIADDMFNNCRNLTTVNVPESVSAVGSRAFKGCASLKTITLTGVNTIGAEAFSGCSDMTSIFLNARAAAPARVSAPARDRSAGIDPAAFDGVNPNCIITLDSGVAVPAASGNYLETSIGNVTETMPDGSIVEREGRIYTSVDDITFQTGYPLDIPNSFNIGEGNSVSLACTPLEHASVGNWSQVVVPFGTPVDGYPCTVATVNTLGDGDNFVIVDELEPNVPSLVRMKQGEPSQEVVFSATSGVVPATPAAIECAGPTFGLSATYSAVEVPADGLYLLSADGSCFERYDGADTYAADADASAATVSLPPFSVYATSREDLPIIDIDVDDSVISGVSEVESADESLLLRSEDGVLVIYARDNCRVAVYAIDGRVMGYLDLHSGRNTVDGFVRGVYVIAGVKVSI